MVQRPPLAPAELDVLRELYNGVTIIDGVMLHDSTLNGLVHIGHAARLVDAVDARDELLREAMHQTGQPLDLDWLTRVGNLIGWAK